MTTSAPAHLKMHLQYHATLFLQTAKNYISAPPVPSGPVYTWRHESYGFTQLFDLNMKIHFKTTREKKATHSIQNEH